MPGPITHHEQCWKSPEHHGCAMAYIAELQSIASDLDEARDKSERDFEELRRANNIKMQRLIALELEIKTRDRTIAELRSENQALAQHGESMSRIIKEVGTARDISRAELEDALHRAKRLEEELGIFEGFESAPVINSRAVLRERDAKIKRLEARISELVAGLPNAGNPGHG